MNNKCKIAFNTKFVSSLTGASVSQLNSWDKINLVKPSILQSEGKGSMRLYSFEDIVEIKTVLYLKANRIKLRQIKIAVEYLKKELDYNRPLKEAKLITNGYDVIISYEEVNQAYRRFIAASRYGQILFPIVVPIKAFYDEVHDNIIKYEERAEEGIRDLEEGKTLSFDAVKEKYFNVSVGICKKTRKRS